MAGFSGDAPKKIDLGDRRAIDAAVTRVIRARARWFAELAIDNLLAAYDGDGKAVRAVIEAMLDHMEQ